MVRFSTRHNTIFGIFCSMLYYNLSYDLQISWHSWFRIYIGRSQVVYDNVIMIIFILIAVGLWWCLKLTTLFDQYPRFVLGFIDFIVNPTLTILGDTLDAILKPLDYGRKPVPVIIENSVEGTINEKKLFRPWIDILVVNKARWTEKHDAGNNIF